MCGSAGIPSTLSSLCSADSTFIADNIHIRDHANYSANQEVAITNFFEEGNDEAVNVTYGSNSWLPFSLVHC
jgi:hypothetical protein